MSAIALAIGARSISEDSEAASDNVSGYGASAPVVLWSCRVGLTDVYQQAQISLEVGGSWRPIA